MFTKHGFMSRRTPTPLQFSTQHCSSYSTSTWTTVDASQTRRAPTATKRRPVRKKQPVSFCPVHSGRQAFSRCCLKSVSRGIRLALLLLLNRYDPNARNSQGQEITDDIETEAQRVKFVRDTCQLFSTKARLKINAKKVYAADGHACREMLKIADMMYKAQKNQEVSATAQTAHAHVEPDFNLANRTSDMKMARELTSEITECGLRLFELLKNESENKKVRSQAINLLYSGGLDMDKVETEINTMTTNLRSESERMEGMCKQLEEDEKSLMDKIDKKQADLDRCKKRLSDLENVRPAFMDEFEKLEKELEKYYGVYIEKYRNVEYLEHELERYNQEEQEKLEESERNLRRMQKRLKEEELKILRGEHEGDLELDDRRGGRGKDSGRPAPAKGKSEGNIYGSLSDSGSDSDMSEVLSDDNSGVLSSQNSEGDLIDEDDDDQGDDLSDMISGDSQSSRSLSDNDF